MSSSSKKSAPATKKTVASKAVECPKSMKIEDGTLSYSLQEKAAEEWVVLSCVGPEQTVNVGPISFDEGSVSITQKLGGNRCILRLDKGKYTLKSCVVVSKDLGGPAIVATFEPHTPPTCQFESNHGDEGKAVASGFPLAIQSGKMHRLQLRLSSQGLDWKVVGAAVTKNANALKGQLMQLCTGHSSANPDSEWAKLIKVDRTALELEKNEQEEQLGLFEGCKIRTHRGRSGRGVVVEIFPGETERQSMDTVEFDFNKKVGQQYTLHAPHLFPVTKDTFQAHPIFGQPETGAWEITVMKKPKGYEAPIVGIIRNAISDSNPFVGEDHGVSLTPISNDVLAKRAMATVDTFEMSLDEYEAEALGYIKSTNAPPKIPAFDMFRLAQCAPDANKFANAPDVQQAADLKAKLNETQFASVEQLLNHKVSIVWGPPGTGKSRILAEALLFLLGNTAEKAVVCAVTNVAVAELYGKCVKGYGVKRPGEDIPYVFLYSDSMVLAQYANGDWEKLDDPNHIDSLRAKIALERNEEDWLQCRQELRDHGNFVDAKKYAIYMDKGRALTRVVLERGRVVFCTVTTTQTPALYEKDKDGNVKWAYPATSILLDEAGVATRPQMMMPAMAFKSTVGRYVLAGDPKQLPAFVLTAYGKKNWPSSMMGRLIEEKWPYTFLDTQYRMPEPLYEHLLKIIYTSKTMKHARSLDDNSQETKDLLARMPLSFHAGSQEYSLTSYLNFVDVSNGSQQKAPKGTSSYNLGEVAAVDGMVRAILATGYPRRNIAVMTGYREQHRLLEATARSNGWSDIRVILTIDSSQGSEHPVVIESLVATGGTAAFLGSLNRSNVATSRQMEALFFVGQAQHWFHQRPEGGLICMHKILASMKTRAEAWTRPPFIIRAGAGRSTAVQSPFSPSSPAAATSSAPINTDPDQPGQIRQDLGILPGLEIAAETRKQRLLEDADREEREAAVVGAKAREKLAEYQTLQDEADAHSRRAASLRQEAAGIPVDEEAMAMRMQGMGISDNL